VGTSQRIIVENAGELAARAAELICREAALAVRDRGSFSLVLAGGSTPQRTYVELARHEDQLDWSRTYLFFGDERYVPPDDARSNYRMALESLIGAVPVDEDHVFPIPTSLATSQACARMYSGILSQHFHTAAGEMPVFDLVLLGLGEDGHTASLFPGARALAARGSAVTSSPPGTLPPPVDRITLTYPAINAARGVLFLVSGAAKAEALGEIWRGRVARRRRPAAGVRPKHGTLTWLVDRAAAGKANA
jgi:6-phosphogluconolactonase